MSALNCLLERKKMQLIFDEKEIAARSQEAIKDYFL